MAQPVPRHIVRYRFQAEAAPFDQRAPGTERHHAVQPDHVGADIDHQIGKQIDHPHFIFAQARQDPGVHAVIVRPMYALAILTTE